MPRGTKFADAFSQGVFTSWSVGKREFYSRLCHNGAYGWSGGHGSFPRGSHFVGTTAEKTRRDVAALVGMLRHSGIAFEIRDTVDLLREIEIEEPGSTTVFIDPPYKNAGHGGQQRYCQVVGDGGALQQRVAIDYDLLGHRASALVAQGVQTIVCEGISTTASGCHPGWGPERGWKELGRTGYYTKELVWMPRVGCIQ